MQNDDLQKMMNFLQLTEKLKVEKRNSYTSNGEKESVASHSWRVALMTMLLSGYLDNSIDTSKAVKMALIHDIVEAEIGDEPYHIYEKSTESMGLRAANELAALKKIKKKLPEALAKEIEDLWLEFESAESEEAKFVQAVDKMEAQIQDNEIDFSFWTSYDISSSLTRLDRYCRHDSFLTKMQNAVQQISREKIQKNTLKSPN